MKKILNNILNSNFFQLNLDNRNSIINNLILFSSTIFVFIFSMYTLSVFFLFLKIGINSYYFPISLLISFGFLLFNLKTENLKKRIIHSGLIYFAFLFFLILSISISMNFFDTTWDGLWYHQQGVILLENAWNPIYEMTSGNDAWIVNHYAKGAWIYEAAAYSFLKQIEAAKFFNILLIISSFSLVLSVLMSIYKTRFYILIFISFLLAFNPISLYQIFSFYIDGQLSSILLSILAIFFYVYTEKNKRLFLFLLFICLTILLNLKITGTGYAIVLSGGFALIYLLKKEFKKFMQISIILFIFISLGVLVYGFNPYVKNTIGYGHPFYPLNNKVLGQQPANFEGANRFEKAMHSYFSTAGCVIEPDTTSYKAFFDTTDREAFKSSDARISGFGSLYNVIIVVTFIILVLLLFLIKRKDIQIILYIVFFIILSAIINPEFWWARYVPQLYFIPLILTFVSFQTTKFHFIDKILLGFNFLNITLIIINLKLISQIYLISNINISSQITTQLESLKEHKIIVNLKQFVAMEKRLIENNIEYTLNYDKNFDCDFSDSFIGCPRYVMFCIPQNNNTKHEELLFDAEQFQESSAYIANKKLKINKKSQTELISQEKSKSGKNSLKLTADRLYGFSTIFEKVENGDVFKIEIWRNSSEKKGKLVATAQNSADFYLDSGQQIEKNANGWEKIKLNVTVPPSMDGKQLKIYAWNPDKNKVVFFDDLKITYLGKKQ